LRAQSELANRADKARRLGRQFRVELRDLEFDNFSLLLGCGKVDEQMKTAAPQSLRQFARPVGRQNHGRPLVGRQCSQFGNAYLEIRKQLEQKGLELLVSLVDLVDQQHDPARRRDRSK
jgi:hypothetical protein